MHEGYHGSQNIEQEEAEEEEEDGMEEGEDSEDEEAARGDIGDLIGASVDEDESGEASYEPNASDDPSSAHELPSEAFMTSENFGIVKQK